MSSCPVSRSADRRLCRTRTFARSARGRAASFAAMAALTPSTSRASTRLWTTTACLTRTAYGSAATATWPRCARAAAARITFRSPATDRPPSVDTSQGHIPTPQPPPTIFGQLLSQLEESSPAQFQLPNEVKAHFKGGAAEASPSHLVERPLTLSSPLLATLVAVAPNGAYVDGDRLRPMKAEFVHFCTRCRGRILLNPANCLVQPERVR